MADHDGISYLRSTRSGLPTLYGPDEAVQDRRVARGAGV